MLKIIIAIILPLMLSTNLYGDGISGKYKDELIGAVNTGNYQKLKLLDSGSNPNLRITENGTPIIFLAVMRDYPLVTEVLVKGGADIESQQVKGVMVGATPLLDAICRWGAYETALKLVVLGADVNKEVNKCDILSIVVRRAISNPDNLIFEKLVKALLKNGIDINKYNGERTLFTALSIAVMKKAFDYVKLLIQAGADPNISGSASNSLPLYLSIYRDSDDLSILKYLLENGADPLREKNPGELLKKAFLYNKKAVSLLLNAGASNAMLKGSVLKGSEVLEKDSCLVVIVF